MNPLITFSELLRDCEQMNPKQFEEKYGVDFDMGKIILNKLWHEKLEDLGEDYQVYSDSMPYSKKDFSKNIMEVEIFEEGVHNGMAFDSKDLEEIVSSTNNLMKDQNLQIPVKLGHSNEQEVAKSIFGNDKGGMPALGWVKNLRKVGKKVIADLTDVPDKLYAMLKDKRYATRSIELWQNFKNNKGQDVGSVITGLALLGAVTPAVTSLANIFNKESEAKVFNTVADVKVEEVNIKKGENVMEKQEEVKPVVKEEVKAPEAVGFALKDFKNENEVSARLIELKKSADEGAEAIKELAEFKRKAKAVENESFLFSMGKEGKLLPFQIELLKPVLAEMTDSEVEYFDKGLEVTKKSKVKALFQQFVESLPNQVQMKETSMHFGSKKTETLDDAAKEFAMKNKVNYETAVKEVLRTRPELKDTDFSSSKKGA
jgi:hypothetical protein